MIQIVVASAFIGGAVKYKFYHPTAELPWPWIALVANTAIVFGFLIKWFRYEWETPAFWICLALLLMGHIVVYLAVLTRVHFIPLVYYLLLNNGELALFAPIIEKFVLRYGD